MRECSQHYLYLRSAVNAAANWHQTPEVLRRTSPKETETRTGQEVPAPSCQHGRPRGKRYLENSPSKGSRSEVADLRLGGKLGKSLPVSGVRDPENTSSLVSPSSAASPCFLKCGERGLFVAPHQNADFVRANLRLDGPAFWRCPQS